MKQSDLQIKYLDFQPSDWARRGLETVLQEIHDKAPDGSLLKASFSRKKNLFKGVIQIQSSLGPFFAVATGPGLREVSDKLAHQMQRRFERWKAKRFKRRSLKFLRPELSDSNWPRAESA
ncbi:MAG: hypothetical protein ACAH59_13705 [Pseudobdellovibrionaceae bacterium]